MTSPINLHADIDARVRHIRATHPDWPCAKGCDACCRQLARMPQLTAGEWELLRPALAALPPDQLEYIDKYLKSGKPVMGFRTSTHSFNFPKGDASEKWNAFGEFALNAPPGWGGKAAHTHYGHESSTDVSVIEAAKKLKAEYNSDWVVIKAQIHAGGRGKGGGVKLAKNLEEVKEKAGQNLSKNCCLNAYSLQRRPSH